MADTKDLKDFGKEFGIPEGGLPLGTLDKRREKSIGDLWLLWSALDALGICIYAAPPTRELQSQDILGLVADTTNQSFELNDLFNLGLMRLAIQRDVNFKLGIKNKDDDLPASINILLASAVFPPFRTTDIA